MLPLFEDLLGNGSDIGIKIEYAIQEKPKGIADAFIIGRNFIGNDNCALILGDNIFYGHGFVHLLKKATACRSGASIFAYWVANPEEYGVVDLDENGNATKLVEKPLNPTRTGPLLAYISLIIKFVKSLRR